jgi:hypothetical protein
MDFTERTPLETGFAAVCRERVVPALAELEHERRARLRKARLWMAGMGLAGLALGGVILAISDSEGGLVFAAIAVIAGIIGGFVARSKQASGWSGSVEKAVMPPICEHVGNLSFDSQGGDGFPLRALRELRMIPNYDRAHLCDHLAGRYRDTDFEMVEAKLTRRTRDSDNKQRTDTVFRGLMFHIAVPAPAPTPILITRDYGALGNKLGSFFSGTRGRGMPRVELDHPAFEEAFEVHAEDPGAVRRYLPPPFLGALLEIAQTEGGKKGAKAMVAGFRDDSFYLALSRGGRFMEMGALNRPVTEMEEDLHAIFADIELVHRIIDRLHVEAAPVEEGPRAAE